MRTVRDEAGRRYLLVESGPGARVRDPATGEERRVDAADLEPVDEPPLATAATAVPEQARRLLSAVSDERALGLLVELDARGPLSVRELLDAYGLCESHLHGMTAELRAAGLVTEAEVAGRRGYDTTARAVAALSQVG